MTGCRAWAIPEGYIPSEGIEGRRDLESHEAVCSLNASDAEATVAYPVAP